MKRRFWLGLVCVCSIACTLDGFQHATVSGDSHTGVPVLYDSAKINDFVNRAHRARLDWLSDPTGNSASEMSIEPLMEEMGKEPAFTVRGGSRFHILFEADYLLYSKVQLDSGPETGKIGWISVMSFEDPRTHMP